MFVITLFFFVGIFFIVVLVARFLSVSVSVYLVLSLFAASFLRVVYEDVCFVFILSF